VHVVHTESVKALGGQSLRLIAEARRLREAHGHRVTVIGVEGSEFHHRAPADIDFVPFRYPDRGPEHGPIQYLRARRLLRRLEPDVVHTHSSRDAWVFGVAARMLGLPIVRGRHVSKPVRGGPFGRLVYTRLADAFTASGPTVARTLIEGGVARQEDVWVTPAGLDFERFDAAARDPQFLRRELGLDHSARIVGSACNLRRMKGIDVLLAAFDLLREAGVDAHLALAGKSREGRFDEARARHPGRVHPLGFRDDIERVIGGFDVLAMASRSHEGIPGAILQAMALGVPVVGMDAGGIADVVLDGRTGLLAPPEDARGLADRLAAVLAQPAAEREAMCGRALAMVREDYGLDAVVGRYLEAYERARAKRAGRGD
jgi:glycosyltransferase involved in cell wall biosynthesis